MMKPFIPIFLAVLLMVPLLTPTTTPPITTATSTPTEFHVGKEQPYTTIQEAVDAAASGGTIIVHPGTYGGFSVEDKDNVSIIAPEGGVVLHEAIYMADWQEYVFILLWGAENINIENIELDGAAISGTMVNGLGLVDCSVKISDVIVRNIVGSYVGFGIYIGGYEETASMELSNVIVENCSMCITIQNAEATIKDCSIDEAAFEGGYGIVVLDNSNVTIKDSEICNCMVEEPELGRAGIALLVGMNEAYEANYGIENERMSSVEIRNCNINNNNFGVAIDVDGDLSANYNNIVESSITGVVKMEGSSVDATYNWWGDPTGPYNSEANPEGQGIEVTANVIFDPWLHVPIEELTPEFAVSNLAISPNEVETGVAVNISVDVENIGYLEGTYSIPLKINGATVDTKDVTLGIGEAETVIFTLTKDTAGSYDIEVDGTTGSITFTTPPASPKEEGQVDRGCIIATSTFGSTLAPEVQFLRTFREETVYSTFAGTSFMAVFNTFYYSWSPTVAAQIWQSESLQSFGRVLISPLLGILHVSTVVNSVFSFSPELGILITGLVASSLIGLVYFFPVTLIPLAVARKYRKTIAKASNLKPLSIPWVASLGLIALSGVLSSPILMMIGTGMLVVFTIALIAGTLALKTARFILTSGEKCKFPTHG